MAVWYTSEIRRSTQETPTRWRHFAHITLTDPEPISVFSPVVTMVFHSQFADPSAQVEAQMNELDAIYDFAKTLEL